MLSQLCNTSKTCVGLCHHDILVASPPYTAEAMALTANYLPVGILCLLHHIPMKATTELHLSMALPSVAEAGLYTLVGSGHR
jgi:hypothetical protein